MFNSVGGLPVLLEGVDTDLSNLRHIWVEDLGQEHTFRGSVGEIAGENQADFEQTAFKRGTDC